MADNRRGRGRGRGHWRGDFGRGIGPGDAGENEDVAIWRGRGGNAAGAGNAANVHRNPAGAGGGAGELAIGRGRGRRGRGNDMAGAGRGMARGGAGQRGGGAMGRGGHPATILDEFKQMAERHDIDAFARKIDTLPRNPRPGTSDHRALLGAAKIFGDEFANSNHGWNHIVGQRNAPDSFAHICNCLSRLPGNESVLARVGVRVKDLDEAAVTKFGVRYLSLLVSSLSKFPRQGDCKDGASRIARHLNSAPFLVREAEPQSLSLLANGLSKWPRQGECRAAMTSIAKAVEARHDELLNAHAFNGQALSNLANAFGRCLGEGEDDPCRAAMASLAQAVEARSQELLNSKAFNAQNLSNLANAFSKCLGDGEDDPCRAAMASIARAVEARHHELSNGDVFNAQSLSNLANAFGKCLGEGEGDPCRAAMASIARTVEARRHELSNGDVFKGQELSNLANAFGKCLGEGEDDPCRAAMASIARAVEARRHELSNGNVFNAQNLSSLANAFGKCLGEGEDDPCRAAMASIAGAVEARRHELWNGDAFNGQALSNLANAFGKCLGEGEDDPCRVAMASIAGAVEARRHELSNGDAFNAQNLSSLANAFGKCLGEGEDDPCRVAMASIARAVEARRHELSNGDAFKGQELSNLANAFGKCLGEGEDDPCRVAMASIAGAVEARRHELSNGDAFNAQNLSNLANAFGKCFGEGEDDPCRAAMASIAGAVEARRHELSNGDAFNAQNLSNLANAFGKCFGEGEDDPCRVAMASIAGAVEARRHELSNGDAFNAQNLSNLVNAFSRLPQDSACRNAVGAIAEVIGPGGRRFGSFDISDLAQLAHGMARVAKSDDADPLQSRQLVDRIQRLADHLDDAPDKLEQASALSAGLIARSLGQMQLHEDLNVLAPQILGRMKALQQTGLAAEKLETMGTLCAALLPLARGETHRRHRRETMEVLDGLQPIVKRKIDLYLDPQNHQAEPGERFDSRRPALSLYQVLKTYEVVAGLWKRPTIPGKTEDIRERQRALKDFVSDTLERSEQQIDADLSSKSWNMIAQIEADNPLDALDTHMNKNADRITEGTPPTRFDMDAVLDGMNHGPRQPDLGAGQLETPAAVVNLRGQRVRKDGEDQVFADGRYSILARLTDGKLPVISVDLPGKPGAFMLGRTVTHNDVPYRMDLFGGSRMKGDSQRLEDIFAAEPGVSRRDLEQMKSGGKLLALPYAETAPNSDLEGLARRLLPNKESFYYFQRMMMASPPEMPGLQATDHILEGRWSLGILPDRPYGEGHPFQLQHKGQPDRMGEKLALRPHDGCGFIKESVARSMAAISMVADRTGEKRVKAFGEERPSNLPAQALQHYPRDEATAREAESKLEEKIASRQSRAGDEGGAGARHQPLEGEMLFRSVTAGSIQAPSGVVVPVTDDRLYLPKLKSPAAGADVLIGRAPYDKPNLQPFKSCDVVTASQGDATAAFLDRATAMQYSFVARDEEAAVVDGKKPMFFAKGMMVVVPDEMWPIEGRFAGHDMVMSAEDIKTHSAWRQAKSRAREDQSVQCTGILAATGLFAPGSLVGVGQTQKRLDGDYDGDTAIVIGDRPALYSHVAAFNEEERKRQVPSLKPPKSHTPAIDENGRYAFGRLGQILATKQGVTETYSGLQQGFLAQSPERRAQVADRALFGTYQGIAPEFRKALRAMVSEGEPAGASDRGDIGPSEDLRGGMEREKSHAVHPAARQIADLLAQDLDRYGHAGPDTPIDDGKTINELGGLFPELAEAYGRATTARQRIEALLDHYPARMTPTPDGYDPDDAERTLKNLISLGIKTGTDAYKSDTSVRAFTAKAGMLQRILARDNDVTSVAYGKATARQLRAGTFDAEEARANLTSNPTLAARIMEVSLDVAQKHGLLSRSQPAARKPMPLVTNPKELAQELHERALVEKPGVDEAIGKVIEKVGGKLVGGDKRVRSQASLSDQLTWEPPRDAGQPATNALRYFVELQPEGFVDTYRKAMRALDEAGFDKRRVENHFRSKNATGVKTTLSSKNGYAFTVEFHTPETYRLKTANHDTYKELQSLNHQERPDQTQIATRLETLRNSYKDVAKPAGIKEISLFPRTHALADPQTSFKPPAEVVTSKPMEGQTHGQQPSPSIETTRSGPTQPAGSGYWRGLLRRSEDDKNRATVPTDDTEGNAIINPGQQIIARLPQRHDDPTTSHDPNAREQRRPWLA